MKVTSGFGKPRWRGENIGQPGLAAR